MCTDLIKTHLDMILLRKIRMKLTKQKLEQLITEEYTKRAFHKRRQYPKGGTIRAFGDEDQPVNRPELQDKLTTLGSSGPEGFNQALDLADTIGEPLDIEFDPTDMQTFHLQSNAPLEMQHGTWFDYVMSGYADDFESPIDMDRFKDYVKGKSEDEAKEIYDQIESDRIKLRQRMYINQKRTEHDRKKELEKLYGLDLRPDWMKRNHYD